MRVMSVFSSPSLRIFHIVSRPVLRVPCICLFTCMFIRRKENYQSAAEDSYLYYEYKYEYNAHIRR